MGACPGLLKNWYCGGFRFAQFFIPKGYQDISRWLSEATPWLSEATPPETMGEGGADPERIEESSTPQGRSCVVEYPGVRRSAATPG